MCTWPHNRALKHMNPKLTKLKEETEIESAVIVCDFNTPFLATGRTTRQKIRKNIEELNNTINQQDLIGIYKIPQPKQ